MAKTSKYIKPLSQVRDVLQAAGLIDPAKYQHLVSTAQRIGAIAGAVRGLTWTVQNPPPDIEGEYKEWWETKIEALGRIGAVLARADMLDRLKYDRLKTSAERAEAIAQVVDLAVAGALSALDKPALNQLRFAEGTANGVPAGVNNKD